MLNRLPTNCGDVTCSACVVAGDYLFLGHHAGGHERADVAYQMHASFRALRSTLEAAGAALEDMVQINLYLKDTVYFAAAREVFAEYFPAGGFPARMTTTTDFISPACLCMLDGVAYRPRL